MWYRMMMSAAKARTRETLMPMETSPASPLLISEMVWRTSRSMASCRRSISRSTSPAGVSCTFGFRITSVVP